jgi:hypothetical protein
MLEIILVFVISKKIAAMMKEKGRSAVGYILLFIFLWFAGEVVGAIVGVIFSMATNPNALNDGFPVLPWIFALVGAAVGGGIGYTIAAVMPAVQTVEDERWRGEGYDDDEDDRRRPARRGRSDDEEGAFEDADRPSERRGRRRDDGSFREGDER